MTGPASPARAPRGYTWGVTRYFRRGTGELRRDSDRIESGLIALLLATFIGIGSLLGFSASQWAEHSAVLAHQAAKLDHQVRGVVLDGSPAQLKVLPETEWPVLSAPARWTLAGRVYTGLVPVPPSTRAGQTVSIWVDSAGQSIGEAPNAGDYGLVTVLTVVGVELALGTVLALIGVGGRLMIDRKRVADWDRALQALSASAFGGPGHNDSRLWW